MSRVVNLVRPGSYFDSVALMRIAQQLKGLPGIEEAGLMMGTPSNREVLADAAILVETGHAAGPGDLIIALRASSPAAAEAAAAEALRLISRSRYDGSPDSRVDRWQPRTLRTAHAALPDANLVLISVPGDFAASEAEKALARGLNVMIFSDNVPLADEIALKRMARGQGLLVMGPDCGTAIISGVPLGFANAVPRGSIGIVGASGTGIQEVSCLIARHGGGISHAIGTGGRDLKTEVGGITTLMAIDLLDRDPGTDHIVLISKPPGDAVARAVLERIEHSRKPFTICFLGAGQLRFPSNATAAATLEAAAHLALSLPIASAGPPSLARPENRGQMVRGLYAGGTLCSEAQIVALALGARVASNVPVPGALPLDGEGEVAHQLLDLGDDIYTRGRPHPMIEPAVRDDALRAALADPSVGVVLVDVVLGTGGHPDPAGHLAAMLSRRPIAGPLIVASVTGTDGDAQGFGRQTRTLEAAGVIVAPSNAAAARLAFARLPFGGRNHAS